MSIRHRQLGFSLLELLIAMALTGIVMAAAVTVYKNSVQVSNTVGTRTELQSEMRSALNQIARDLNQAGTGIPLTGLPIPSTTTGGVNPLYGCDSTRCYLTAGTFTTGNLNRITPGDKTGITTSEATDAIVITYIDPIAPAAGADSVLSSATGLDWSLYTTQNISDDGSTLTMPVGTTPVLNDPTKGLMVGDLLLMQNFWGTAISEVTAFDANARTITFGANDPLLLNQPNNTPVTATLAKLRDNPFVPNQPHYKATSVARIIMVSYFIWQDPTDGHLMLMRQVNGRAARPVAEYIEDLQITYDMLDDSKTPPQLIPNVADAVVNGTVRPDLIRKINLRITARSPNKNAQGLYDRMSIATSVGPRNLSFHDTFAN
jgi:prepilin-type N-terminal cleavage/methylation domain-containing protein